MALGTWVLMICFVVTGSINTIVAKWIDNIHAVDSTNTYTAFNHPFLQAWFMFVGEMVCLIAFTGNYYYRKSNGLTIEKGTHQAGPHNPAIFMAPAACDLTGTTLLYIGMTKTHASVAQMLRGSSMIFTAFFSVAFLGKKLLAYHWVGMGFTAVGLALVGLSSMVFSGTSDDAPDPVVGNILIIAAQVIVGVQMVVEEKILGTFDLPPMHTVGWEGIWGMLFMWIILSFFQLWPKMFPGHGMPDDMIDGFIMIGNEAWLVIGVTVSIFSIAFFNFFGLTITKTISATTRTVLDSIRTVIIWVFGLLVQWQTFQWLQPVGFVVMLLGTAVYRKAIRIPGLYYEPDEEEVPINSKADKEDA